MDTIKVMFVGNISSGKSSVINSLVGGFVASAALARETYNLTSYTMSSEGSDESDKSIKIVTSGLATMHKRDQDIINEDILRQIHTEQVFTPRFDLDGYQFIDMPAADVDEGVFTDTFSNMHLIIFVTTAADVFRYESEMRTFRYIHNCINTHNKQGRGYIKFAVLINKYDDIDDEDLQPNHLSALEILKDYPQVTEIFRYSSHKTLLFNCYTHQKDLYCPTSIDIVRRMKTCVMKTNLIRQDVICTHDEIKWNDQNLLMLSPDYDNFIGFLQLCKTNIPKWRLDAYINYSKIVLAQFNKKTCEDKNLFKTHWNRLKISDSQAEHEYLCSAISNKIMSFKQSLVRNRFVECAMEIINRTNTDEDTMNRIVDHITDTFSSTYTLARVLLTLMIQGQFELCHCHLKLLTTVLLDPNIYSHDYDLDYYSHTDGKYHKRYRVDPHGEYSWYVGMLITRCSIPDITYILKLSKYTYNELLYLYKIGKLDVQRLLFPQIERNIIWTDLMSQTTPIIPPLSYLLKDYISNEQKVLIDKIDKDNHDYDNGAADNTSNTDNNNEIIECIV